MPSPIEQEDYDLFDYKHFDDPDLTLDEAIAKATRLRTTDNAHLYRVVATDTAMTRFRVTSVSADRAYAGFLSRITAKWASMIGRLSK